MSKTWLDHSLKSAVSEHPSTGNKLNVPKHFWNLHDSTFIIFFHHSEEKWFGKYLLCLILKASGCFLRHGLPITSILFRIVRIWSSLLKWYLVKKKLFWEFFFHLWNLHQILNILKKNKIVIANVFPKLTTL